MPYANQGSWFYFQFGNRKEQGANLSNEDGNIFPTDWLCCIISKGTVLREVTQDVILLSRKTWHCALVKCALCSDSLSLSLCLPLSQQLKWKEFLGDSLF